MSRLDTFEAALKNYDHQLRVRWHQQARQYAVEREMRNVPPENRERSARAFHRIATRSPKPNLTLEQREKFLATRAKYRAKLDAINERHRILFFLPDLSDQTLNSTLYTLKSTDNWVKGKYVGDSRRAAEVIENEEDYEERFREQQHRFRRRRDYRDAAKEHYPHTQYKFGSRVSMAGAA